MPEAPEVEILRAQLCSSVVRKRIRSVEVMPRKSSSLPVRTSSLLKDARITGAQRFGKILALNFDVGVSLLIHLMMVGQLRLLETQDYDNDYTELVLHLDNNSCLALSYVSLRFVHLVPTQALGRFSSIAQQGADVLSADFSYGIFSQTLKGRRGAIKPFLMDQKNLAGLGNTYVDEILFSARVDPRSNVPNLTAKHQRKIFEAIRKELRKGLELGGSSEMNYVDLFGEKGRYHKQFQVNRRKKKPCVRCGTSIDRIVVGGRGTYFCPGCQELV